MDAARIREAGQSNTSEDLTVFQESLGRYLSRQLGDGQAEVARMQRLSGGAIQENWLLDVQVQGGTQAGIHHWVLRTDALSVVNVSMSRAHEFAVLTAVHSAGAAVPEPLWLCQDLSVIGREFFIMTAIRGVAAGPRLVKGGTLVPDRGALCRDLGRSLARIHRITPPQPGLEFLPAPVTDHAENTINQYLGFLDDMDTAYPAIEMGLRWLQHNKPAPVKPCLLHRDFRTGNFMVDEGRLSGILDWEFAGWGDWREDLGWFSAPCWRFGQRSRVAGGIGSMDDLLSGYREVAPVSITSEELRYWQLMAVVRWAIVAVQQGDRHRSGQQQSLELALTGRMVPELELDILTLMESEL